MINDSEASNLKEKQRSLREGFSDSLGLRVHRSISWLQRAAKEGDDPDAAFVFLWIASVFVFGWVTLSSFQEMIDSVFKTIFALVNVL